MNSWQAIGFTILVLVGGGLLFFLNYAYQKQRRSQQVDDLTTQTLVVRTYRSQAAYQRDARALVAYGFRPTSVTEQRNNNTWLYVILILLFWLIVPLIF